MNRKKEMECVENGNIKKDFFQWITAVMRNNNMDNEKISNLSVRDLGFIFYFSYRELGAKKKNLFPQMMPSV